MKSLSAIFLLFILSCTHQQISKNPPVGTTCSSVKHSFEWKYCITTSHDLGKKDVIYYFHGGGGSESDWIDPKNYTAVIRKEWQESGKPVPTVVAVSIGELWAFSDRIDSGRQISSYDDFLFNFLPGIEKNILKFFPASRIALGESMGGFNAAAISLRNPDLFSKTALVCPGVLRENIFLSSDMKAYIESTGAQKKYSAKITQLLNSNFDTAEQYQQIAPQSLLKKLTSKNAPKLFLSCGQDDQFGFFIESKTFVEIALAKNLNVSWKPVPGKHCALDIESLTKFLVD